MILRLTLTVPDADPISEDHPITTAEPLIEIKRRLPRFLFDHAEMAWQTGGSLTIAFIGDPVEP